MDYLKIIVAIVFAINKHFLFRSFWISLPLYEVIFLKYIFPRLWQPWCGCGLVAQDPGHKDSFGSAKSSRAMRYLWRGDPDQSRGLAAVSTHCGGEAWNENLEQIRSGKPSRNWWDKRRARGPGYSAYYVCLPSWQPEQYLRDEKVFKLRKYLSCKNKWGQFLAGWHRVKDKMNVGRLRIIKQMKCVRRFTDVSSRHQCGNKN